MKAHRVKCTCPRGRYSTGCRVDRHRELAWDINTVFHSRKLTFKEQILHCVSSKRFARGLYLVIAGLFLLVAGNTVRQIVVSEPSVPAIIRQQTERKTVTAPVRDPELLPSLDEAFNKPIVVEGEVK